MATNVVGGLEKVEIAPQILTEAAIASAVWSQVEHIAPDSVAYTRQGDTTTDLIPEDKDVAFVTFYQTGEADTITIGVLEQKPELMVLLENGKYVNTTTTFTTYAKRKVANLAIRLTTRPMKDGRKCVIIFPNVAVTTTFVNNLTKTAVQQLLLTGRVGSFKTTTDNIDAIMTKTFVTEAGAVINSPAIV